MLVKIVGIVCTANQEETPVMKLVRRAELILSSPEAICNARVPICANLIQGKPDVGCVGRGNYSCPGFQHFDPQHQRGTEHFPA